MLVQASLKLFGRSQTFLVHVFLIFFLKTAAVGGWLMLKLVVLMASQTTELLSLLSKDSLSRKLRMHLGKNM